MPTDPILTTFALLKSLVAGPLLVGDLPEAKAFVLRNFSLPNEVRHLNLEQKLGHLYEDALAQLLQASPRFEILAKNLQIQKDIHTTVGELDFLIRDLTSGQLIHLELATKFYLAVQTKKGLTLPGPDARDNYFKKLTRLREHQLQLPTLFNEHLPETFRNHVIMSYPLVYGCLFDHIEALEIARPEFTNPGCRRGKWLHLDDLSNHFGSPQEFQIVPKHLWPVPFEYLSNLQLEPWTPTGPIERCLMVKTPGNNEPLFIAPSGYPNS
ncbi:MAG: hypothetical protein ACJAVK_002822 [Akkermansiaceae bacterium]|jgi:hypothetical protein